MGSTPLTGNYKSIHEKANIRLALGPVGTYKFHHHIFDSLYSANADLANTRSRRSDPVHINQQKMDTGMALAGKVPLTSSRKFSICKRTILYSYLQP